MWNTRPLAALSAAFILCLTAGLRAESQPVTPATAAGAGELSPAIIEELRGGFTMDPQSRALHNAVTNNDINDLALNRDIIAGEDGHFSHRIKSTGITNQEKSGRCWMFAGFNTMRPKVMAARGLPEFEFSASYLQFWDKMEKANLFLEYMIEMRDTDYLDREWQLVHEWTLNDGGWWNFVVDLIEKYGVVPQSAMPATHSSQNTSTMNKILTRMLQAYSVKIRQMSAQGKSIQDMRTLKKQALADVYRFLVINLGEPPREFEWRYEAKDEDKPKKSGKQAVIKTDDDAHQDDAPPSSAVTALTPLRKYTPQSFYKEYVGVALRDYVCLYNDVTNPYMTHLQFKRATNMAGSKDMDFVNVDSGVLQHVAMQSIVANEPVWFAANVSVDQDRKRGLMADKLYDYGPLFGVDLNVSRADRIKFRDEVSNHAMVFMGVDVRDGKPGKWLVENSWGADTGNKGTWTLNDKWFDEHVFVVIINKKYIPANVLKVFDEKPTVLPAWYPGAPGVRE